MTTSHVSRTGDAPAGHSQPQSWGDNAVSLVSKVAQLATHNRGDVAALRRMDPDNPDAAAFWRLMAEYDLLGNPVVERKWALILHGIALMTPTSSGKGVTRTAHNGFIPVGQALFWGREAQASRGFYSESRLNRLLTARGPMLRTLLARLFRMLASDVPFNWREMASFILNEGYNEEAAEQARHRIARAYYQAERRSAVQDDGSN